MRRFMKAKGGAEVILIDVITFVMSYQENPQVIRFMVFITSLVWKSVWRGYLHFFLDYCEKSDSRII